MIESLNLFYMIELGLLFILFITGAWKKSITTLLFVASLVIVFYELNACMTTPSTCWKFIIENANYILVTIGSIFAVIRAIMHKDPDIFIRNLHV